MRCAGSTGIMFLNEVVLGKEHHITQDDWRLKAAPKGYDCIIAKGWTEPGERERPYQGWIVMAILNLCYSETKSFV